MYTLSKKLKTFAIGLMILGSIGIVWGFLSAPSTVEEAKEIVAQNSHGSDHGETATHEVAASHDDGHGAEASHAEGHDVSHDEHVFHQLQNRP